MTSDISDTISSNSRSDNSSANTLDINEPEYLPSEPSDQTTSAIIPAANQGEITPPKKKVGGARPGAGRPSNAELKRTAELTSQYFPIEKQRRMFNQFLTSKDEELRFKAACYLMDRIYGKARQQVEVSGEDGDPLRIIIEHIAGRIED